MMQLPFPVTATDMIVGEYTQTGGEITGVTLPGDPVKIEKIQKIMKQSVLNNGGEIVEAPKKPTKQQKAKKTPKYKSSTYDEPRTNPVDLVKRRMEEDRAIEEAEERYARSKKPAQYVKLHNDFGQIKFKVEDVISCDMAYALIFACEEDILFTPKPGQTIQIEIPGQEPEHVYYPSVLFDWTDGKKKVMILIKSPVTQQEEDD